MMTSSSGWPPGPPPASCDVVIIGGGVVGAASAYVLAQAGLAVALLERENELAAGASAGTAGLVTPTHAECVASPRSLRKGVASLIRRDAALALRPLGLPAGWLARFALASTSARAARAGTRLLRELAQESLATYDEWDGRLGLGLERRGVLNVWRGRDAPAERDRFVSDQRQVGIEVTALDERQTLELEPSLRGISAAAHCPAEAHLDAALVTRELARHARAAEATVHPGVVATSLRTTPSAVTVATREGVIECGHAVIATGVDADTLARDAGLRLPIVGARGYHVEFEVAPAIGRPVYLIDDHVVVTPLPGRLRLAGRLELGARATTDAARRADALIGPAVAAGLSLTGRPRVWAGERPLTSDGMPVIGRAPNAPGVIVATGHGMLGLTLAPSTALRVAALVWGEELHEPALDPARF
jgi:D-amino-acid dehydrogenase